MGYARHIGRVGALAVALGVGAAVAGFGGTAWADQTGSGSSTSGGGQTPKSATGSAGTDATGGASGQTAADAPATNPASPRLNQPGAYLHRVIVRSSGGLTNSGQSAPPLTKPDATPAFKPSPDVFGPHPAPVPSASAPVELPAANARQDIPTPSRAQRSTAPVVQTNLAAPTAASAVGTRPSPAQITSDISAGVRQTVSNATAAITAATDALTTAVTKASTSAAGQGVNSPGMPPADPVELIAKPAAAAAAPVNPIMRVVSGLLAAIGLNPNAANNPVPAVPPQTLMGVLALIRREIEATLAGAMSAPAQPVLTTATIPEPSATVGPVTATSVQSPNLLVNPGAEIADPSLSGYSSVTVPGWTVTGTPTVIEYGTVRRLPWPGATPGPTLPACLGFPGLSSEPPGGGQQFFGGGPVATSTLTQTVDLSGAASQIDTGTVPYTLSADLGGYLLDPSAAAVTVEFLGARQQKLGTGTIGPVTAWDRGFQTVLLPTDTSGTIPVGTRSAQVVVTFTDCDPLPGNYNDAFADNLSFTVGANLPAPPPPTPPASTVGGLDHVFIIYMENHGVTDIVGSPNAPYINSLINTYGFASNYYALTHPSDPNYYPILGGSDFGINYNCPANCINAPNLADEIEAAGETWAGYEQNGGGYSTPTDQLPFLVFSDIYNDPARVQAHLFPLTQLATDLAQTATTPNFAWIAADENNNMEGPITGFGAVLFVLSQLTNHQYNISAGDTFLQDEVTTIMNSPVWQDPTQKSAIFITWDEDYNNLSLGIGNQGNNVPMIVIPSAGAVASGMRGGEFVAGDYYNHYSLERTIENALGLPPLTINDTYAEPMNEFWT